MGATYLYGIVPTGPEAALPVGVTGVRGGLVRTLSHDGLTAVIGPSELDDYRGLAREELVRVLFDHQRVIEQLLTFSSVLPAKFSTVLAEDSVAELLVLGHRDFGLALAALADKAQTELIVQWNLEQVFGEIGRSDEIARLRTAAETASPDNLMAARVEVGKTVQVMLQSRRTAIAQGLLPRLVDLARDSVVNPEQNDGVVLNVALLLDAAGRERLDALLPELDAEFDGALDFRSVGPLPPYSFATLEVEALSFEQIDCARRLLGLPEVVTAADVKHAYHRAAGAVHPDLNPDRADAEARMTELTEAHRILFRFVASLTTVGPRSVDRRFPARPTCSLTRSAVARALLFSIARQQAETN